jgi:hypothetical protein
LSSGWRMTAFHHQWEYSHAVNARGDVYGLGLRGCRSPSTAVSKG